MPLSQKRTNQAKLITTGLTGELARNGAMILKFFRLTYHHRSG